jgi:prepilin signal peptidase PulO-like enzyme (type II secretory pathway)
VELVTTLLFLWLAFRDVYGQIDRLEAWGVFLVHAAFCCALLVCTLIDWEFRIIPDEVDVPGMLLIPLAVGLLPALIDLPPYRPLPPLGIWAARAHDTLAPAFGWWGSGLKASLAPLLVLAHLPQTHPDLHRHLSAFAASVFGAVVGAGFIFGLGWSFTRLVGKDAMGFGDVKYLGMIGALTGWQGIVCTLVVGCVAGSLGGLAHMLSTGRSRLQAEDLAADRSPLGELALSITGARADAGGAVKIRFGTGIFARLATGDPYVPFGPFLSVGAFVAAFWPGLVPEVLSFWRG